MGGHSGGPCSHGTVPCARNRRLPLHEPGGYSEVHSEHAAAPGDAALDGDHSNHSIEYTGIGRCCPEFRGPGGQTNPMLRVANPPEEPEGDRDRSDEAVVMLGVRVNFALDPEDAAVRETHDVPRTGQRLLPRAHAYVVDEDLLRTLVADHEPVLFLGERGVGLGYGREAEEDKGWYFHSQLIALLDTHDAGLISRIGILANEVGVREEIHGDGCGDGTPARDNIVGEGRGRSGACCEK